MRVWLGVQLPPPFLVSYSTGGEAAWHFLDSSLCFVAGWLPGEDRHSCNWGVKLQGWLVEWKGHGGEVGMVETLPSAPSGSCHIKAEKFNLQRLLLVVSLRG